MFPTLPMLPRIPNTLRSHRITTISTTTLRIFFIPADMGIYVLISHIITPMTTRMMISWSNPIVVSYAARGAAGVLATTAAAMAAAFAFRESASA